MDQRASGRFWMGLLVALAGLAAGLAFALFDRDGAARIAWTAGVLPALGGLAVEILRGLRRGEFGLDVVAAFSRFIESGGDVARLTTEICVPEDYESCANGRLAFRLLIGARKCASGGGLPAEQTGAMIRANFAVSKDGSSIVLADYSYHLDRRTKAGMTNGEWEGRGRALRAFGTGRAMERALPKGEWVTLVLDVTLNTAR